MALATDVSGTLPVANGGTGAATLTAGSLVVGNGTTAVTGLAAGAAGNVIYGTSATAYAVGTPDTAGLVDKSSAQTITGLKSFNANANFANTRQLQFNGSTANYVGFRGPAGAVATSLTWELPAADGTSGQVLKTNGAGVLSWVSGNAGTVTGVTGTAPVTVTGTTTPVISMAAATGAVDGYLSAANFTLFNNKMAAPTGTVNSIPKFLTASTIGNSSISDNGSTVSVSTNLDVTGALGAGAINEGVITYANSGAAYTIPDTTSAVRQVLLTANATVTLPAFTAPIGKIFTLSVFLKQDGTGSRTITWAGNGADTIKWDSGNQSPISNTPGKITILQFTKPAHETVWYASEIWQED